MTAAFTRFFSPRGFRIIFLNRGKFVLPELEHSSDAGRDTSTYKNREIYREGKEMYSSSIKLSKYTYVLFIK